MNLKFFMVRIWFGVLQKSSKMTFHLTFLILGELTKPTIEVVRVTENSVNGNVRLPGNKFLLYFRSITYNVSLTETAGMCVSFAFFLFGFACFLFVCDL